MTLGGSTDRDWRVKNFVAALGFLQLEPRAPELRLLHRWLDSWSGIGLIVVGMSHQGSRSALACTAQAGGSPSSTAGMAATSRSRQRGRPRRRRRGGRCSGRRGRRWVRMR
jgi:hypothetical protein